MSLFSKARAFTLGNLHDLLDKTIDLNSPAVLKQYVRDLEAAISQLKQEAVVQAAGVRTLNREIGDIQHNIDVKTASIKSRMSSPNVTAQDSIVRAWTTQVLGWQKEVDQKRNIELPAQQKTANDLDAAVAKLEAKHTDMVANVRRLESAVHSADAKTHAVNALEQANSLAAGADGVSIDNLQQRVQAKADVADEKFERAMNSESMQENPETTADVDAFLAGLKK